MKNKKFIKLTSANDSNIIYTLRKKRIVYYRINIMNSGAVCTYIKLKDDYFYVSQSVEEIDKLLEV